MTERLVMQKVLANATGTLATEVPEPITLDVLEGAVTNAGSGSYVVGSLQLSPGIPPYFRPPLFGFPTEKGPGSWYTGLKFGQGGTVYTDGFANNGWYGPPWGSDCPTGCPDALSGGLCLLYTSPSPRDRQKSRMPSSA